jgi:uncharacterized membrane protein
VSDGEAVLRWYLVLTAIAVALLPAVAWLSAGLGGLRYGLVRPLSLVMLTAFVWWPAAAVGLPFTRAVLAAVLVLAGVVGWGVWLRRGVAELAWRGVAAFELLWLGAFLLYAWFRGYQPDISFTGKPMEIALLSSIVRSADVPAPDPWLAGEAINYYYFGYQMVATVVK